MLMRKLTLHNFRQYIGTQEICFSTDKDKNVTVLIGVNTSGKTTFIRAFEWILYNKNDFEDKNLLNKNVADTMQIGDTQEVWGTLQLEHNGREYEIVRKQVYTCTGSGLRPSVSSAQILYLQPDGQTKTEIGSDFSSNIERILPRALSSYFFFGGERVGAISSRADIEASVKGLMGLDILYNAMAHLRLVIARLKKSRTYEGNEKAAEFQQKLAVAAAKKQDLEKELATAKDEAEYYQSEKEKYAALLKANERTAQMQSRREQLNRMIEAQKVHIDKDRQELATTFSKNAFSFFSLPLLKNAAALLNNAGDETESVPEMSSAAIDYILRRGVCICGTHISEGSAAEMHLMHEKCKQPPESIGASVRRYREQALDYISSSDDYYNLMESSFARLRNDQRELGFQMDERDAVAKELAGAKDTNLLEQQYRNAEERAKEQSGKIESLSKSIGILDKEISDYERALDSYGKANQKNARIELNIAYAQEVLDWVSEAYNSREKTVRNRLEEKVNQNFRKMYHGSRTVMIDEKYRVKYIDITTEESDGLRAVKSFAFVAGLVDLAKEALSSDKSKVANIGPQYYPLVMDAPFSNVDETHIRNISQILPNSAAQVIIAVMQKDWEPASEIMAPVIGKSYCIEKDLDPEGREIDTITHIKEV